MIGLRLQIEPRTAEALRRLTPEGAAVAIKASLREWSPGVRQVLGALSPGSKPGNTGNFRRGWEIRSLGDNGLVIRNVVKYGLWVEENTRKHVIMPVRAKVLAWRKGMGRVSAFRATKVFRVTRGMRARAQAGTAKRGDWAFAKRVNHPGTKGQHVLQRTLDLEAPRLLQILGRRVAEAFGAALR